MKTQETGVSYLRILLSIFCVGYTSSCVTSADIKKCSTYQGRYTICANDQKFVLTDGLGNVKNEPGMAAV